MVDMIRFGAIAGVLVGCGAVAPVEIGTHGGGEASRALRGDTVVLADSEDYAAAIDRAVPTLGDTVSVSIRGSADGWGSAQEQWRLVLVSDGFELFPGRPMCQPDADGVHLFEWTDREAKTIWVGECVPAASPIITHAVFHMAGASHQEHGLMNETLSDGLEPSVETLEELRTLYGQSP